MPFELETLTRAKVASVNLRSERHGPQDLVPAAETPKPKNATDAFVDANT